MFKTFLRDEVGAITADWVTLTAALVILSIAIIFSLFSGGVSPVTDSINTQVGSGSAELCGDGSNTCTSIQK